jgi:hypothetical protein
MNDKTAFLSNEFLIMSWMASVQRSNLYREDIKSTIIYIFREKIFDFF